MTDPRAISSIFRLAIAIMPTKEPAATMYQQKPNVPVKSTDHPTTTGQIIDAN